MTDLVVQRWSTECGGCGHGRGGWASSPARKGLPILTPESRECPGCNVVFARRVDPYGGTITILPSEDAAA